MTSSLFESPSELALPQLTQADLVAFEEEIASAFNAASIRAPVHLYNGNEERMIEIFRTVRPEDWLVCSWRSHYQCLLKGVPRGELKRAILDGQSISLCFPKHRIFSSAIVGGGLPIAVGIALGIKRRKQHEMVYCFIGDMTAETGIAHESIKYSENHNLPIHFIIEDNGKSVCTETRVAWNQPRLTFEGMRTGRITYYHYQTKYPHAGAGQRIQF
jgi:TPP-dependent pyruvate/acetoin dehydrogenase alpha subunit